MHNILHRPPNRQLTAKRQPSVKAPKLTYVYSARPHITVKGNVTKAYDNIFIMEKKNPSFNVPFFEEGNKYSFFYADSISLTTVTLHLLSCLLYLLYTSFFKVAKRWRTQTPVVAQRSSRLRTYPWWLSEVFRNVVEERIKGRRAPITVALSNTSFISGLTRVSQNPCSISCYYYYMN